MSDVPTPQDPPEPVVPDDRPEPSVPADDDNPMVHQAPMEAGGPPA